MPRPTTRTKQLTLDEIAGIRGLFGSTRNAMRCLRLDGYVTEADMRRALAWLPVSNDVGTAIQDRWDRWRGEFLNEEHARGSSSFVLPAE